MQATRIAPDWPAPSLMHRRRVVRDRITYVGLDVHKDAVVVAIAEGGIRGEVREYGRIANTATALDRLIRKLGDGGVRLWHSTSRIDARPRMRRRRPLADPEASGRPGQDGSAGCSQSGAAASGGRVDGSMGS